MQPTSNKEYLWRPGDRVALSKKLKEAKKDKGITYAELADRLGVNKIWLAAAIDGQQWVPKSLLIKLLQSWESQKMRLIS